MSFKVNLHTYVPTVHKDSVYKDQILHSVGYMSVSHNIWSAHLKGPAGHCLLYTSPSPRDLSTSRMPSSA